MNKRYEAETEVLDAAINALKTAAGLELRVVEREARMHGDQVVDAVLETKGGKLLYVEVKKWAQQSNRGALVYQLTRLPKPAVLVADYVNPNMAKELQAAGIQFFDTVGNAFLDLDDRLVYLVGEKAPPQQKPGAKRAFNATGLKVTFALLTKEWLLDAAYRDIAHDAGVALGTVGGVINDLKDAGFLVQRGEGGRRELKQKKELLQRWVENYLDRLRPKLFVGRYVAQNPLWWNEINIREINGVWGGEVGADKLVHVMRPKVATVFINKTDLTSLIQGARLKSFVGEKNAEPEGLVNVYEAFWPMNPNEEIAHPLIVYANLIGLGNPRANEAAEKIYEQYLA